MKNESGFIWYKLFCSKGFGTKTINNVHKNLSSKKINIEEISNMPKDDFLNILGTTEQLYRNWSEIDDEICFQNYELLKNKKVKLITPDLELYPQTLIKNLGLYSPPLLFCGGNINLLNKKSISIIGARNVNDSGIKFTKYISREMALGGKNVVSGYAKGVDLTAHISSLESDGTTTIVLSSGIYDFKKKKQFKELNWDGNILGLSQFDPSSKWQASHAMIRNKTTIGLTEGVIIVQSGPEVDSKGRMSGTFNSGKLAIQYNIPLFVLSPSVVQNAEGNQKLIDMGAVEIDFDNAIDKISNYKRKNGNLSEQIEFF